MKDRIINWYYLTLPRLLLSLLSFMAYLPYIVLSFNICINKGYYIELLWAFTTLPDMYMVVHPYPSLPGFLIDNYPSINKILLEGPLFSDSSEKSTSEGCFSSPTRIAQVEGPLPVSSEDRLRTSSKNSNLSKGDITIARPSFFDFSIINDSIPRLGWNCEICPSVDYSTRNISELEYIESSRRGFFQSQTSSDARNILKRLGEPYHRVSDLRPDQADTLLSAHYNAGTSLYSSAGSDAYVLDMRHNYVLSNRDYFKEFRQEGNPLNYYEQIRQESGRSPFDN